MKTYLQPKRSPRLFVALLFAGMLLVTACGAPQTNEAAAQPTVAPTIASTAAPSVAPTEPPATMPPIEPTVEQATVEPTAEPITEPTSAPVSEPAPLPFTPATYRNPSAGIELDYPADWTIDPSSQVGVRGGQALLLSPGTTLETIADGGTRISLVTYVWDPKNALEAWVAQRKTAWDASGFAIDSEETWQLADGRVAYIFTINMPTQPSFVLLTTIGEDYLQISGDGDLTLAADIARTLRPSGS